MYFNGKISVIIEGQALQTVVSISVKNDGNQIGSYCEILVPLVCRMEAIDNKGEFTTKQTTIAFSVGNPIKIMAQYVGYEWQTIFEGYIYDFVEGTPTKIKCLDEIYWLNQTTLNLSYKTTTFQQVLKDVLKGTGITVAETKVGESKMDFQMYNLTFPKMSPAAILEYLKKPLGLCMSLHGKSLYCNLPSNTTGVLLLNTSINVIKSDLQKPDAIFHKVHIRRGFNNKDGTIVWFEAGDPNGTIDELKVPYIPEGSTRQKITDEALVRAKQLRYSGTVETMLYPDCQLFWKVIYIDIRYPKRSGNYTIQGIDIEISDKGYRRKLKLAYLDETERINGQLI